MDDLEERLRHVIKASVADAQPSFDVMDAVRRRHRRHLRRVIGVTGGSVIAAIAVLLLVVFAGVPQGARPHSSPAATPTKSSTAKQAVPSFPGGGRLLFSDRHGLKWIYSNGRVVRIARGFFGAEAAAGRLVAWNNTGVYAMNLDGSRRRLVFRFGPGRGTSLIEGALSLPGGGMSPDGSRLAYYVGGALWVAGLATGGRVDLGRAAFVGWRDNTTILASSGRNALVLVNAETGGRIVYLMPIGDRVLIRAYERARPNAGRPAVWNANGFSGSGPSPALAIALGAAGPFMGKQPAEVVLLAGGRAVAYAPAAQKSQQLEFTWGPNGLFLLQTWGGDKMGTTWKTYVGTIRSRQLSQPIIYGMGGGAFSPGGNVIALQDDNQVTVLPAPRPACQGTAGCLNFQPKYLVNQGKLLAWVP
jgi:hypothetical protein